LDVNELIRRNDGAFCLADYRCDINRHAHKADTA